MITFFDISNIAPDPSDIINKLIQLVATLVMFLIASKLLFKPVREILKKRADYVENNIKEAEKSALEASNKNKEADQNILEAKAQASLILENAKNDALVVKEQLVADAHQEVSLLKDKAYKEIEQEKQKAREEINREIVDVALLASNKILKREVNDSDNKRLVEDFIKDVVN